MKFLLSNYEIEEAITQYIKKELSIENDYRYIEIYPKKSIKKGIPINHDDDLEMEIFIEFE